MRERTRRWIVSANTGRIIDYVHNTKRKNTSDRLRRHADSNQVRAESGERSQSSQGALTLHHRASGGCGTPGREDRSA